MAVIHMTRRVPRSAALRCWSQRRDRESKQMRFRCAWVLALEAKPRIDTHSRYPWYGKDDCGNSVHQFHWDFARQLVTHKHRRHIGNQHTQRGAQDNQQRRGIVCRQGHGGNLRLSPISARKKRQGGTKTPIAQHSSFSSSILSGIMVQIAMPMKDSPSTQRKMSGADR